MIEVAVNGYGTIGKRVADAVAAHPDMKVIGVSKTKPSHEAFVAKSRGYPLYIADDVEGDLALKPGWPAMFRGYLHDEERYRKCFVGGWYLTGDLAERDMDGYFWFVGRADDIIKTAGHMVGLFEVESALMEHPAVAEAGVIGTPDPIIGELRTNATRLNGGNCNSRIGATNTYGCRVEGLAPEPASLALMGFALAGLGLVRRRS